MMKLSEILDKLNAGASQAKLSKELGVSSWKVVAKKLETNSMWITKDESGVWGLDKNTLEDALHQEVTFKTTKAPSPTTNKNIKAHQGAPEPQTATAPIFTEDELAALKEIIQAHRGGGADNLESIFTLKMKLPRVQTAEKIKKVTLIAPEINAELEQLATFFDLDRADIVSMGIRSLFNEYKAQFDK